MTGPLKNPRHEAFAENLAKGMSASAAYAAAGYKPRGHSAAEAASRLSRKPTIKARVAELMAPAIEKTGATVERVLAELVCLAFYDLTLILDSRDGKVTMKDPTSLPEDLRRAIVRIKPADGGYECWFADKEKALEMLARHLQMFRDVVRVENVFDVVRSLDDDALTRRLQELERALDEASRLPGGADDPKLH